MVTSHDRMEIEMTNADEMVTQLYQDNGAFILSYVTGLLRDRHLAEDVVQETMVRAWRHCDQFSPEKGSVRGWLMRVAHNIAMDKMRMRQSRPAEVPQFVSSLALVDDHADSVVTAVQVPVPGWGAISKPGLAFGNPNMA